jgi:hypothetical protein
MEEYPLARLLETAVWTNRRRNFKILKEILSKMIIDKNYKPAVE